MSDRSVADLVKQLQKDVGEGGVVVNPKLIDVPRIPTGIYPLDFAIGGGLPLGKFSIIFGPESSGKTNIALKTIASFQELYPDKAVVFLDIENAFDPKWAAMMGVNLEPLILAKPTYGEQAVDWLDEFLKASDIGLVVVDSLAALTPESEATASSERTQVGGASLLIGKMIRKCLMSFSAAQREGRYPLGILINQIRYKVGLVFGDPEKQPGGMALQHASGLTIRVYGKNEMDKSVSAVMPVRKKTSAVMKKWKVPIIAANCEYTMAMLPYGGMPVGYVPDAKALGALLKDLGWLAKDKQKWTLLDHKETFSSEVKALEYIYSDPDLTRNLKISAIKHERDRLEQNGLLLEFE